jgi:hypothetical protein
VTCIIGLVDKGEVWMGADSAFSTECNTWTFRNPKIFRRGDLMVGVTGDIRVSQVMQFGGLDVAFTPPPSEDFQRWVVGEFVPSVRTILQSAGVASKKDEVESFDSRILIGHAGQLCCIECNYGVSWPAGSFFAVGSGADVAMGALYGAFDTTRSAEDRILLALKASERYCRNVRGPLAVLRESVPARMVEVGS